jgi:hypothetical protein
MPVLIARFGHTPIGTLTINGAAIDWEKTIRHKVVPRIFGLIQKHPDKILVVLDREDRDCCPQLARIALSIIQNELGAAANLCDIAVIVSDRYFECTLFADYDLIDRLAILSEHISQHIGDTTDGVNVFGLLHSALMPGKRYDKVTHGLGLARKMSLSDDVIARSRALQKLKKELAPDEMQMELPHQE